MTSAACVGHARLPTWGRSRPLPALHLRDGSHSGTIRPAPEFVPRHCYRALSVSGQEISFLHPRDCGGAGDRPPAGLSVSTPCYAMNRRDLPASQLYRTSTWLGPGALPWRLWPRFRGSQATLFTDRAAHTIRWLAVGKSADFGGSEPSLNECRC